MTHRERACSARCRIVPTRQTAPKHRPVVRIVHRDRGLWSLGWQTSTSQKALDEMNDSPSRENEQVQRYRSRVLELIEEVARELERLRSSTSPLESQEGMAWRRLELIAHNIAARADALELRVL